MSKSLTERIIEWNSPRQLVKNIIMATAVGTASAYGGNNPDLKHIVCYSAVAYTVLSAGMPVIKHVLYSALNMINRLVYRTKGV